MHKTSKKSNPAGTLLSQLYIGVLEQTVPRWVGYPGPSEYCFAPPRRWRADIAWENRLIVEVQGGIYRLPGARMCPVCKQIPRGGHNRPGQYESDCEKMVAAQLRGYTYFMVTPNQIQSGQAFGWIQDFFTKWRDDV